MEDFKVFVKKDKLRKKFRKKLNELENELRNIRFTKEMLVIKQREAIECEEKVMKKVELHRSMMEKSKMRSENMKNLQRIWSLTPEPPKPKYLELEQSLKKHISEPRSQKPLKKILKLPELTKSPRKILSVEPRHDNQFSPLIKNAQTTKSPNFHLKTFISPTNLLKSAVQEEIQEKFNRKKIMMNKRKYYSELVKELYSPKIDLEPILNEKKTFIKNFSEKNSHSSKKREKKQENIKGNLSHCTQTEPVFIEKLMKSRKKIIQKMVTETLVQAGNKTSSTKDYLKELRINREKQWKSSYFLKSFDKSCMKGTRNEVIQNIKGFDKILKNGENKVKMTDAQNIDAVQMELGLSELLVDTVKAKLQLLTKN